MLLGVVYWARADLEVHLNAHPLILRDNDIPTAPNVVMVKEMTGLSFKCTDLGFACDFEVDGVKTKEEIVEIIKAHGKRCHDIQAITPDIEKMVAKAIKGETD